ncbi:hypothetical protein MRX96_030808 [Rhipicephalus microplus]
MSPQFKRLRAGAPQGGLFASPYGEQLIRAYHARPAGVSTPTALFPYVSVLSFAPCPPLPVHPVATARRLAGRICAWRELSEKAFVNARGDTSGRERALF